MAQETEVIENRVAKSSLITFDLEELYHEGERILFDVKDLLYQGLILRENDFKEFVKSHDWSQYEGKNVAITCSADAIVPTWAYMQLISKIQPYAHFVVLGNLETLENSLYDMKLDKIDFSGYEDCKVVVKGCSQVEVPAYVYAELTRRLRPYVASLMYGEPCSSVPVYKKPRKR